MAPKPVLEALDFTTTAVFQLKYLRVAVSATAFFTAWNVASYVRSFPEHLYVLTVSKAQTYYQTDSSRIWEAI